MCNFHIVFTGKTLEEDEGELQLGEIKVFDFIELFRISLSYWDRKRYLYQWREGLERILQGYDRSMIISSMYDPENANFIFCWVLFLEGDVVYIQNRILFLHELEIPFDERNIYCSIRNREVISESGHKISEWNIRTDDIQDFLKVYDEK